MEIEGLIRDDDFEKIDEMLKEGKITLRNLIDIDDDSIEKLARNLNLLKNVNLDDLINAFGFMEDSFGIGLFASYAVGLTESHIDTLLDFIIKNDDIQVLLESLEGLKRSFALRLRNKIKEQEGAENILDCIERIIYCSNSFYNEKYIRELMHNRDFKTINEMLEDGEITLIDLVLASEDDIEILARNLNLLENVNLDDLINAFGFIEDSYVIGQFVSSADDLTESHIDTLLDFIIKNNGIQVLLEDSDCFSKSFILRLGNKINDLNDAEKIIAYIEKIRYTPGPLLENFARTISSMHDYDLSERFLELLNKPSKTVFNILGQGLSEKNNVEDILNFICMRTFERSYETEIIQYLKKHARIISLAVSCPSATEEDMRNYKNTLGINLVDSDGFQQRIGLLTDEIVLTNDLERIYLFALRFWCADKAKIAQALIESNNFKWVYKFAKNIENIPEDVMKTIVTYVASTKSPEFIYLFLSNINLSVENIKILADAIIRTENTEYIGYSVIRLGRILKIENDDENLSKEQEEMQIAELKKIKSELTVYLVQRGNFDFLINYDDNHLEELEEILENSDDSIENPFAPVDDEKRMKLEGNA